MGRAIIMHIDDAPWTQGVSAEKIGTQLIGERDSGQHVLVPSLPPNQYVAPHTHNQDEVIFVLDGELTLGDKVCGPGTVIFIEGDTEYSFTSGPNGLRFLNVRPGPTGTRSKGEAPYHPPDIAPGS